MAASVLRLAAAVLALCAAAQTVAASPQDRAGEGGLDCGSRLSALVACELPDQLLDVDRGRCCAAILAFHTAGCMCETYDKDVEVAALEATTLFDALKDSLYVRCPAISGQLPPAVPCPATRRSAADASVTETAKAAALQLRAAPLADAVNEPLFGGKERTGATTSDGLGAASNEEQPATIGSSRRLTSGMHVATLPSGFVVDDLQNSGASLPQRSSYHAASTAAAGSARSARVKTMHELHHPEGRGTGHHMAARVNHWVEGLLIKPFTAGNAMAAERSDEQRHAAHAAASAAQAAGATQRALARSQAAVDPTDIDATLAAASLSSSETPRARHADSLTTASSTVAEDTAASRSLWAADDPRPAPVKPLQLFGASGFEGGAGRAHSDAGRTVDVEYQLTVEGLQPVVEIITERVASGYASGGAALFAGDGHAAAAQRSSTPQLALFLNSFLQRRRGGGEEAVVLRAARRLGPGHYTARMVRNGGDGWLSSSSGAGGASLYQLRLSRSQAPQDEPGLFSPGRLLGPTFRAVDSFNVDVDIELLPVSSGLFPSLDAGEWLSLRAAAAKAHVVVRGAARRAAGFRAAANAWTCAHRHLLLGLFAVQLALTTLIFLAVHVCSAAAQDAAAHGGVVDAATEARVQLCQPLLAQEHDVDAANPLHSMVVLTKTP